MSLQVWLPLNGDLRNNGTENVIVRAVGGATVNTSGKIGSCYQTNGSDGCIEFDCNANINTCWSTRKFTVCFWIYRIDNDRGIMFGDFSTYGSINFNIEYSGANGRFYWNGSPDYGISNLIPAQNTWYHIAVAVSPSDIKFYRDGVLVNTNTIAIAAKTKTNGIFRIARDNRSDSTACNARWNDFRLYNETLTEKQIKEISKGLILHHTLNYRNPNRISRSQCFGGGHNGAVGTLLGPYKCTIKMPSVTNSNCRISGMNFNGSTGPFAVSLDVMSDANGTVIFDICDHSSFSYSLIANQWKHIEFTDTVSSYNTSSNYNGFLDAYCFNTVANQIFTFKNYKLEDGSIATEFCESTYDPNISYDVSGYYHNGTVLNGPLTPAVSPRYQAAAKFTATNKKIKISNLQTSQITNSYTISWWSKQSTFGGTMAWGFSNGIRLNGIYCGNLWNTGDSSNNPLYQPGTTTQVSAPSVNVWHHFAMIGDGSTCKVYKDGTLWSQAKTYTGVSGTELFINGWNSATEYSMSDLTVSDFRLYATALSAADVKELYETSMIVNSDGTISPRVLIS